MLNFQRFQAKLKFLNFSSTIHKSTLRESFKVNKEILSSAVSCSNIPNFDDLPNDLREVYLLFNNIFIGNNDIFKIIVHTLPFTVSPAGYSIYSNYHEALQFLGLESYFTTDGNEVSHLLQEDGRKCLLLSHDNPYCRNSLDWTLLSNLSKTDRLVIGLNIGDLYDSSCLDPIQRINDNTLNGVSFYISFSVPDYILSADGIYSVIRNQHIPIISLEFGCNCFLYRPLIKDKIYDYVLLASSNSDKRSRYYNYLPSILHEMKGLINGPGWPFTRYCIPRAYHSHFYACSKVGLNLHIESSLKFQCDLNERFFNLISAGIPQIVDKISLMDRYVDSSLMYLAENPREYYDLFHHALDDYDKSLMNAAKLRKQILENHTIFHRMKQFLSNVNILFNLF